MGFYTDGLEKYREKAPLSIDLTKRLGLAKKCVDEMYLDRVNKLVDQRNILMSMNVHGYNANCSLHDETRRAHQEADAVIRQTPEMFFGGAAGLEEQGLISYLTRCQRGYDKTEAKLDNIAEGKGLIGRFGIFGIKENTEARLSAQLEEQGTNLTVAQDALQDWRSLSQTEQIEYVLCKFEQGGPLGFNPQALQEYAANQAGVDQGAQLPNEQ